MAEHGGFEHNRHGLRVVDHLERRYPRFRGLNLTYEVRESFMKHHTTYDTPKGEVPEEFHPEELAVLESQVVAAADEIAYDNHDIDDGLSSGLLEEQDLEELALWQRALALSEKRHGPLSGSMRHVQGVRLLINIMVEDVTANTLERVIAKGVKSARDIRECGEILVGPSEKISREKAALERYLQEKLYRHYRVCRMANKARHFVQQMFGEYVQNPNDLPPDYQETATAEGAHRAAADYIAGMTDRFAQDEFRRLFHPFERV